MTFASSSSSDHSIDGSGGGEGRRHGVLPVLPTATAMARSRAVETQGDPSEVIPGRWRW